MKILIQILLANPEMARFVFLNLDSAFEREYLQHNTKIYIKKYEKNPDTILFSTIIGNHNLRTEYEAVLKPEDCQTRAGLYCALSTNEVFQTTLTDFALTPNEKNELEILKILVPACMRLSGKQATKETINGIFHFFTRKMSKEENSHLLRSSSNLFSEVAIPRAESFDGTQLGSRFLSTRSGRHNSQASVDSLEFGPDNIQMVESGSDRDNNSPTP